MATEGWGEGETNIYSGTYSAHKPFLKEQLYHKDKCTGGAKTSILKNSEHKRFRLLLSVAEQIDY